MADKTAAGSSWPVYGIQVSEDAVDGRIMPPTADGPTVDGMVVFSEVTGVPTAETKGEEVCVKLCTAESDTRLERGSESCGTSDGPDMPNAS